MIADDLNPASRFEWERLVRRSRLSPATKLVAYSLAQYGNRDGTRCRPGNGRLTATTGLSDRMVRYALEQLRGVGLVARVFLGGSAGRRGLADEYRLTVPDDWLDELEALSPDERTPATSAAVPPPEHRHSVPEIGAGTPATSAAEKQEQRHSATGTPALSDTELRHSVPTTKEYTKDVHHPGNNSPSGGTAADAPSRAGECEHGEPRGPKSCALCRQDAARADAATAEWDRALT